MNKTDSRQRSEGEASIPLKRSSLRGQVRSAIIDLVFNGGLPAGKRINETELARRLGVSQTPVREALLSLEGQSFLAAETGKGFRVRALDPCEVRQIYPVHAELESFALGLAGLPDTNVLAELKSLNEEFARAESEPEQAIDLDTLLHRKLLEGCGNAYLLDLIAQLRRSANRYAHAYMRQPGQVMLSFEQHNEILAALEVRNLKRAVRLLRKNDLGGVEQLVRWLSHNKSEVEGDYTEGGTTGTRRQKT
ncbi:MAG: GntR family transcriptional regulator [Phycisphaerales bacterium]|nr:MAG: GntR family transcriptional regulator [Phycisphaerales bacterium]